MYYWKEHLFVAQIRNGRNAEKKGSVGNRKNSSYSVKTMTVNNILSHNSSYFKKYSEGERTRERKRENRYFVRLHVSNSKSFMIQKRTFAIYGSLNLERQSRLSDYVIKLPTKFSSLLTLILNLYYIFIIIFFCYILSSFQFTRN